MKKLAFYRLMLALRSSLPLFVIYLAGYFIFSILAINFVTVQLLIGVYRERGSLPQSPEQRSELVMDLILSNGSLYGCITILLLLVLIWLISRRLPLSLPRVLYACPLNGQEKVRYLRYYLMWKCICLLCVLTAASLIWGFVFYLTHPPILAVQLSLMAFTLMAFSLNPDSGNRREALKKCPDIVTERSSNTFVNVYWSALLLLENTIFYSMLYSASTFTWTDAAWWILPLLLNIYLAKRHVTPVLTLMLNYEKLYFPVENAEATAGQTSDAAPAAVRTMKR